MKRIGLILTLAVALLVGGTAAHAQQQAGTHVDVYPGPVRNGINGRVACSFLDGIYNMRGEIIDQQIIVTDPLNVQYYVSDPMPELANYAVRQMTCLRSAQTGTLVVTTGGFTFNEGTSQALSLATKYFIHQPISYEDYQRGAR